MDRLVLINRALLRIGSTALQGEDDPGAEVKLAVYDGVRDSVLGGYPFSFCKAKRKLTRLVASPVAQWTYAYQLPSDRVGSVRAIYPASDSRKPTTAYDIIGADLVSDLEALWAEYVTGETLARWPGDFTEFFTKALMAEFALSVREDRALHDRLYQECFGTPTQMAQGGLYGRAMENDAQQLPEREVAGGDNPLIDARY